ncbi:MAG TPA: S41 family peptidase [Niastella sp.]
MKTIFRVFVIPALFLFLANTARTQTPYDPARLYSKETLKADLRFVQKNLETKHAGLYRYITKPALTRFFDSLHHSITGPMTEQAFFRLLTLLHEKIKNGHTMFLPGDSAMAFYNKSGRHLPFLANFTNGKLYITENHSADSTLKPGTEILSINGTSASSIIQQLLVRMTRDGNNHTYPVWIFNHYFSSYYSFIFDQHATHIVELKDSTSTVRTQQIKALPKDSIRHFKQIRYPAANDEKGIVLTEKKENNAAILKIKTFNSDILESKYQQNYKQVYDSIFKYIHRQKIGNLILDLRDNQGGHFEPGQALLAYLIKSPSRFLLDGDESKIIQPKAMHFNGKLIVLTNGGSFSVTAIVCASLKRDRKTIFIGEETGGNAHVISGEPTELVLPNTKIKAEISTITYRIIADRNDGHGVMPDYPIIPSIEDILSGKDPIQALAMKLILQH